MNTNNIISQINAEQMDKELPDFGPGDTIVVQVKVKEGNRERLSRRHTRREECPRRSNFQSTCGFGEANGDRYGGYRFRHFRSKGYDG